MRARNFTSSPRSKEVPPPGFFALLLSYLLTYSSPLFHFPLLSSLTRSPGRVIISSCQPPQRPHAAHTSDRTASS
eukprot:541123-Hanusia_phi.AAC.1